MNIKAFGKIAGNQYIPVYKDFEKPPAPTISQAITRVWNSAPGPVYWTDVVVMICFTIIGILAIILLYYIVSRIFDVRKKRRMRKLMALYDDYAHHEKNNYLSLFTTIYYEDGSAGLSFVESLILKNYAIAIGFFSESFYLSGNSVYNILIKEKVIEDSAGIAFSQDFMDSFAKYKAFIDSYHINGVSELLKKSK